MVFTQIRKRATSSAKRELSNYVDSVSKNCFCEASDSLESTYLKSLGEYAVQLGNILLGESETGRRKLWTTRLKEADALVDEIGVFVTRLGSYADADDFKDRMQQIYHMAEIATSGDYVKRNYGIVLNPFKEKFDTKMKKICSKGLENINQIKAQKRAGIEHILDYHPHSTLQEAEVQAQKPLTVEKLRSNVYFLGEDLPNNEPKPKLFNRAKSFLGRVKAKVIDYLDLYPFPKVVSVE